MKKAISLFLAALMLLTMFSVVSADTRAYDARPGGGGGGRTPPPPPEIPMGGEAITGNRYAVVIGISDYDGDSSDLTYADDDALAWNAYLTAQGYTVNLLIDEQATEANILAALQWLADVEQPGDGVVITYSGHGYYDKRAYTSMLISWELTGVTSYEIEAVTDQIETEHVFFFDDACNQGQMAIIGNPGWVLAIGSQTTTYTYDGTPDMAMGIFTYYMMEALYTPMYIMEDATTYTINLFEAATPGDAFMIDAYNGDFYL
ncbi:MAG: caspase family protein [Candidatus Heimdallarchaeota archaeon]|nr:caspase family protein [Candidatus Heimdallarchaeota archaeon]